MCLHKWTVSKFSKLPPRSVPAFALLKNLRWRHNFVSRATVKSEGTVQFWHPGRKWETLKVTVEIKSVKLCTGWSWHLGWVRALVKYIRGRQLQSTGGPHNSYGFTRGLHVYPHVSKVGGRLNLAIFPKETFVLLLFIKISISPCRPQYQISKWYKVGESKNTLLRCKVSKDRQHVSALFYKAIIRSDMVN